MNRSPLPFLVASLVACGGAPANAPPQKSSASAEAPLPPVEDPQAPAKVEPAASAVPGPVTAPGAESADEVRLTAEKDGQTTSVKSGQTVIVTLMIPFSEQDMEWAVTKVDKTLGQPQESARGNMFGNPPTTFDFTWKTKGMLNVAGKHVVEFQYRSKKDPKHTPKKQVVFTVEIQP